MNQNSEHPLIRGLINVTKALMVAVSLLLVGTVVVICFLWPREPVASTVVAEQPYSEKDATSVAVTPAVETLKVVDGKEVASGLLDGEGLSVVKANCLGCHSAQLITQNHFTRDGWHQKIVWMQKTQGLWDLGDNEPVILNYLAQHYAPEARAGRRQPLTDIEWYELEGE